MQKLLFSTHFPGSIYAQRAQTENYIGGCCIILRLRGKLCSLIRVVGPRTHLNKCKQIGYEKEARKAAVDS